jgi:flagellar basal-body rod modification protein FlgD
MQITAAQTAADPFAGVASNARVPAKTLGQSDFLRLLVTQLTQQDPLNPQSQTDFAAQMAQFSSLAQTQAMSSSLSAMKTQQDLLQANSLIGKTVLLQVDDTHMATGVVSSVVIQGGTPMLVVNDSPYYLDQLTGIAAGSTTTTTTQP